MRGKEREISDSRLKISDRKPAHSRLQNFRLRMLAGFTNQQSEIFNLKSLQIVSLPPRI
jgi:hypothetical protein